MAGHRCGAGEAAFKRQRAIELRTRDPSLTVTVLAERLCVSRRTMQSWLSQVGEERTEDARGLVERERRAGKKLEVLELHRMNPGLSAEALSKRVGVAVRTVKEWLAAQRHADMSQSASEERI